MNSETVFFENRGLSEFTTYKIGGAAERLWIPRDIGELAEIYSDAVKSGGRCYLLGGGSNVLISDNGLKGDVILLTECCLRLEAEGMTVRCGASVELRKLVEFTIAQGIAGLERLNGIPGTLGGALRMNAGAYGSEISDHLISVSTMEADGAKRDLPVDEIGFAYRSAPGLESKLVLGAEFRFENRDSGDSARLAEETIRLRASKQPLNYPSAGSVFKKHAEGPAGRFIDEAGLKGTRIGDAAVSEKHANFIVNLGGARAIEVLALMRIIQRTNKEKFGIELELEQKLLGFTEEELNNPERFL